MGFLQITIITSIRLLPGLLSSSDEVRSSTLPTNDAHFLSAMGKVVGLGGGKSKFLQEGPPGRLVGTEAATEYLTFCDIQIRSDIIPQTSVEVCYGRLAGETIPVRRI